MSGQAGSSTSDSLIGRMMLGRYRIVRQLAEGGMGIVYLARVEGAAGFRKPVVIKLILAKLSTRPYFVGMFVREAQILAQLRHPGVVDVIEFGEQDGNYVMVLEYVAGFHLGQWCAYLKRNERLVPTELCVAIAISVLDALHYVHTQSLPDGTQLHITHRDVSPSNILLNAEGYPKLVDFGVARMEADTLYRTEGSGFRGKLAYAAPEMFEGIEAAPQSDVFSCAVVLHELLTGRNEFAGQNQAETLQRVMHHTPQSVHGVRDDAPDDIDVILARALNKTPGKRYASAAEFAQALRRTQRASEQELRARLAALLRADFAELADVLGIESLTERDRAWRRFSLLPPPPPGDTAGTGVHDQPTRVLDEAVNQRQREASEEALMAKTAAVDEPLVSSAPKPQRAPSPHAPAPGGKRGWIAAIVGAALLAGLGVFALRSSQAPPRVVVLQSERPQATATSVAAIAEPSPQPAPSVPTAVPTVPTAVPTAPTGVPAVAISEDPAPRVARTARSTSEPDPAALTRALRRKQAQIEACFAASSAELSGPPIEIHFEVDPAGRALQANVFPAEVARSALGSCLQRVGLATRFPSQSQAVAFRIPVTAKRVAVH